MRVCRFDENRLGIIDGDIVRDVTAALDVLPQVRYPLPKHDPLIANLPQVLARARAIAPSAPALPLSERRLLSPVASPGKLVAAPVNYQTHLDEVRADKALHQNTAAHTVTIQTAGLFLKANSSLVGAGEGVIIRKPDRRTDHEVELAVVIGKTASPSRVRMRSGTSRATRSVSTSRFAGPRIAASASPWIRIRCWGRGS